MYCPKCSDRLEEDPRGWLRCSSGELEFSIDLSGKLRRTYGKAEADAITTPDLSGHELFCPGCPIALPQGTPDAACTSCGISLRPIVHALIELHPHGNGAGKYF